MSYTFYSAESSTSSPRSMNDFLDIDDMNLSFLSHNDKISHGAESQSTNGNINDDIEVAGSAPPNSSDAVAKKTIQEKETVNLIPENNNSTDSLVMVAPNDVNSDNGNNLGVPNKRSSEVVSAQSPELAKKRKTPTFKERSDQPTNDHVVIDLTNESDNSDDDFFEPKSVVPIANNAVNNVRNSKSPGSSPFSLDGSNSDDDIIFTGERVLQPGYNQPVPLPRELIEQQNQLRALENGQVRPASPETSDGTSLEHVRGVIRRTLTNLNAQFVNYSNVINNAIQTVHEMTQEKSRLENALLSDPVMGIRDTINRISEITNNINRVQNRRKEAEHQLEINKTETEKFRNAERKLLINPSEFLTSIQQRVSSIAGDLPGIQPKKESFNGNDISHFPINNLNFSTVEDSEYISNLIDNITVEEEFVDDNVADTPPEMNIKLMKHQRLGLDWLLKMENGSNKGGILADDMGLGKTVQAIALILANAPKVKTGDPTAPWNSLVSPTLIIGPVALLRQWEGEIRTKVKDEHRLKTFLYHSNERVDSFRALQKFDIVLTSYGTLSSEYKKHFSRVIKEANLSKNSSILPDENSGGQTYNSPFFSGDAVFHRVILDEAHLIKNKLTQSAKACALLKSEYRLCLSGTPMQNKVDDLYSLIRFLRIKPYNNERKFKRIIALPLDVNRKKTNINDREANRLMQGAMRKLQALLKAILLRRTKDHKIDGVPILQIPNKTITQERIKLEGDEGDYYSDLSSDVQKTAKKLLKAEKIGNYSSVLLLLLRLRQACCHSYLVRIGDRCRQIENGELEDDDMEESQGTSGQLSIDDVKQMISVCKKFTVNIIEQVNAEIRAGSATCQLCFDGLLEENTSILYPCGHALCRECVSPLFESLNDEPTGSAKCHQCGVLCSREDTVTYQMFNQVCNLNKSQEEVFQHFNIDDKLEFFTRRSVISNEDYRLLKPFFPNLLPTSALNMRQKVIREILLNETNGFQASPKMKRCLEIIRQINSTKPDEKVIIFSQFTLFFDLFGKILRDNDLPFLRYDGSMTMDHRDMVVSKFFEPDNEYKILLISLKAGNVGLTLTCASNVIIVDPFWNPYVEDQAMDRVHRIGQLREVNVHKLLTENTVEDRIIKLQESKKKMVESALSESGLKQISKLGRNELMFLFGINNNGVH